MIISLFESTQSYIHETLDLSTRFDSMRCCKNHQLGNITLYITVFLLGMKSKKSFIVLPNNNLM